MKFAIVHNWPGQRNSELELIKRISRIAAKSGHSCTVVDPFGHPLTDDGQHLDVVQFIDARQYDFCLHLHYVSPHFFDTFSYAVNWNPLDYVLRNPSDGKDLSLEDVAYRTFCLASHDVLLSAGSEEMDTFAEGLNYYHPTQVLNPHLYLHTTAELKGGLDFPDFNRFKVFYIGANWERHQGENRHGRVIEGLDKSNLVDFYGVKKQNGVELWKGVKNYRGELPFDGGDSILDASNRCGVSLVLHSDAHRRSGLVSTRLFQACAAKTLTICDDNPFILKHFGDNVLSFKWSDNPSENVRSILKQVDWIRDHPEEALEKAKSSYRIFSEKFSLENEVSRLFESHQENVTRYLSEFGAQDPSSIVDVLYIHREGDDKQLHSFFADLTAQVNIRTRAVVFTLPGSIENVSKVAAEYAQACEIIPWAPEYSEMQPRDGRLVAKYLTDCDCSPYFALYAYRCRWHQFHLTQLVRALSENGAVSMSGVVVKNDRFNRLIDDYYLPAMESIDGHPKAITAQDLGAFRSGRFAPASFLFSSSHFQGHGLEKMIGFFHSGWAFFLILWHYLSADSLPILFPKLTVMVQQDGDQRHAGAHEFGKQSESFEASLAYAFFKNNPKYVSLVEGASPAAIETGEEFSINDKTQRLLKNRPFLLKAYRVFFKCVCFVLKLPYREN